MDSLTACCAVLSAFLIVHSEALGLHCVVRKGANPITREMAVSFQYCWQLFQWGRHVLTANTHGVAGEQSQSSPGAVFDTVAVGVWIRPKQRGV